MKNILKLFLFLILLTSACYSQAEQTPVISEVHPELKNIPIYPNSDGIMDGNPNWGDYQEEGHTVYSYIAKTINTSSVEKYYEKNMPDEWISLGTGVGSVNNKEWTNMWYYKEDVFVDISISQWTTTSCLVVIDFYSDPNYKQ
jgi:hypothetical protein